MCRLDRKMYEFSVYFSHRYMFPTAINFCVPGFSKHFTSWCTDAKCWHNMLNWNVDSFPWRGFGSLGEALLNVSFEIWRNLVNILLLPIPDHAELRGDWRSTWWVRLFCYLQPPQNDEVAGISLESNVSQRLSRWFPNQRWLPRLPILEPMAKIPFSTQYS